MERFYDAIGYPQAATKTRKFMEPKAGGSCKEHMAVISDGQDLIQLRGNLATFLVGVTSRQNASWQGDGLDGAEDPAFLQRHGSDGIRG